MDINTVCLSGHVFNVKVVPSKGVYPMVEARMSVLVGTDENGDNMYNDFLIRSYGKKNVKIANLSDGDFVTIHGKLKKGKADAGSSPFSGKTYVSVDTMKFLDRG